jgi:hypothetical protein
MIVLVENNHSSTADTFRSMIEDIGLCIVFVRNCEGRALRILAFTFSVQPDAVIRFPIGRAPRGKI